VVVGQKYKLFSYVSSFGFQEIAVNPGLWYLLEHQLSVEFAPGRSYFALADEVAMLASAYQHGIRAIHLSVRYGLLRGHQYELS
jgi:hypothetical protein